MIRLSLAAWGVCCWLAAASGLLPTPASAAPPVATPAADASRHALLVGCTRYPGLEVQQLEGPANDVVLMRQMLAERFHFAAAQIVTLAESQDETHKPTRAHIEREFARLAKTVKRGDQVVILMSGHGTQQPDADPPNPADPEPDGLDEVFLAADAKPFDRQLKTMPGAIVDDELGQWVRRIRDAGALVWIIVDSCHSGTIIRGNDGAVERRVRPEQVVPRDLLAAARKRASVGATRGAAAAEPDPPLAGDLTGIVALYAAQPEQSTIELPLPPEASQPERFGLLTFVVNKVLTEADAPLTYRELAQRLETQYVQWGRTSPTPVLEGRDRDREVLGLAVWPNRSSIALQKLGEHWMINAGALHGLTQQSILRVLQPGQQAGAAGLGFVRVARLGPVSSQVEPCAYASAPLNAELPERAVCELAYVDAGLRKTRIAVDVGDPALRRKIEQLLEKLAPRNALLALATQRTAADWIVHEQDAECYLEPATGFDPRDAGSARFGPAPAADQLEAWLDEHLRRIARAQNLLRWVRPSGANEKARSIDVEVQLTCTPAGDQEARPLVWQQQGTTLKAGDRLACRVHNRGADPVDVTLLFVDSGFGIQCVYPVPGTATDNRVYPGESPQAFEAAINDQTAGLEHLVMIAVPADGPPVDFGVLEQPTLATTRGTTSRGMGSPLGQLLETALYGRGTTRGSDAAQLDKQQIGLYSWRVVRPAGAK